MSGKVPTPNPTSLHGRICSYLSLHPVPRASEVARATGADAMYVKRVARMHKVPLCPEDSRALRPRELVSREELFEQGREIDAHVLSTHEELMLYFREFARARGVPWRVAMTEAIERWMFGAKKRPLLDPAADPEVAFNGVLKPERQHEGTQLLLHLLRR
jgi:hypothetical protein